MTKQFYITQIEKIYQFSLNNIMYPRIVWMFDIDETLVKHNKNQQTLINPKIKNWIIQLTETRPNDSICFLTARYLPSNPEVEERELLSLLGLNNYPVNQLTLNSNVPLFTYTNGFLKGQAARRLVNQFKKEDN